MGMIETNGNHRSDENVFSFPLHEPLTPERRVEILDKNERKFRPVQMSRWNCFECCIVPVEKWGQVCPNCAEMIVRRNKYQADRKSSLRTLGFWVVVITVVAISLLMAYSNGKP